jgi:hypothetical protein
LRYRQYNTNTGNHQCIGALNLESPQKRSNFPQ